MAQDQEDGYELASCITGSRTTFRTVQLAPRPPHCANRPRVFTATSFVVCGSEVSGIVGASVFGAAVVGPSVVGAAVGASVGAGVGASVGALLWTAVGLAVGAAEAVTSVVASPRLHCQYLKRQDMQVRIVLAVCR